MSETQFSELIESSQANIDAPVSEANGTETGSEPDNSAESTIENDDGAKEDDEFNRFGSGSGLAFWILKANDADRHWRITLKNTGRQLPLEQLRTNGDENQQQAYYVEGDGGYYPDFIESNGMFFVSLAFHDYLASKFGRAVHQSFQVGLVSENGKRIEHYCLIIPEEIDCIVKETAKYDKMGQLTFFEIDPLQTWGLGLFKVRGYPYLWVNEKVNRIDFAGFECLRMESFFDYPGESERLCLERASGARVEALFKEFEQLAKKEQNATYHYGMQRVYDRAKIKREVSEAVKRIFSSYNGNAIPPDPALGGREIVLVWDPEECRITIAEELKAAFATCEIEIASLKRLGEYAQTKLPEAYHWLTSQICIETLLHSLIEACRSFDGYDKIHRNTMTRICLKDAIFMERVFVPLLYCYKPKLQREMEAANDLRKYDLNGKDLRGYDLRGKLLIGMKIKNANLRGVKFEGSNLNKVELVECDLTGTEFRKCFMREAVLNANQMYQTNFDYTDLRTAAISGSDLKQCSFVKSDLSRVQFSHPGFEKVYFYAAKLFDAVFEVKDQLTDNVFRLCDLRGAWFKGDPELEGNKIAGNDFSNADLSGCRFEVHEVLMAKFTKARLNNVIFAKCKSLTQCNFNWSSCVGMSLGENNVYGCEFAFVDLSRMRELRGSVFYENDFRYANFSGYDLRLAQNNKWIYTDLTGCNLENVDFTDGFVMFPNLKSASLKNAYFGKKQLPFVQLSPGQQAGIKVAD